MAWRPLGSQGGYPHGGDHRDQWWLPSLAGPHPVHLALCVLVLGALAGMWPAPDSALMGWGRELHWLQPLVGTQAECPLPLREAEAGLHGAHGQGCCAQGRPRLLEGGSPRAVGRSLQGPPGGQAGLSC